MKIKGYIYKKNSEGNIAPQNIPDTWTADNYEQAQEMLNQLTKIYKNITGFTFTLIEEEEKEDNV